MKTQAFIDLLKKHPEKHLYFEYRPGVFVRPDYHITEIKNVHYDTVDCGGARNEWEEVHVQLWESQSPEPNHQVNTTKALKIFEAVGKSRPTHEDAEVKFEYGNGLFHTAVLPVQNIVVDDSNLVVKLMAEQTTCKAKDRAATPGEKAAACCGTSVPSLGVRSTETSVRTAASGCC